MSGGRKCKVEINAKKKEAWVCFSLLTTEQGSSVMGHFFLFCMHVSLLVRCFHLAARPRHFSSGTGLLLHFLGYFFGLTLSNPVFCGGSIHAGKREKHDFR